MAKPSDNSGDVLVANPKARLFDQVREVMRFHHYSLRTEKAYRQWMRRFLVFHRRPTPGPSEEGNGKGRWRHPNEMGAPEVVEFLTHLAVAGNVAASTQNQALNALVFLYEQVLQRPLGGDFEEADVVRTRRSGTALGNVGGDGDGRAAHLVSQPKALFIREVTSDSINRVGEHDGFVPGVEFFKVEHLFKRLRVEG